jgi:spore coat protein A, manganese oxidase
MLSRRTFLKLSAAATSFASVPRLLRSQERDEIYHPRTSLPPVFSPKIDRYIDPLPILPTLNPEKKNHGSSHYRVRLHEFESRLHSQLPPTRLWGYEGRYPGPTIEAQTDESVSVRWENQLPHGHLFPIDPHLHGAMPPSSAVRTVTHLHGARTRSADDGLPESWMKSGKSATYSYSNHQAAATLWYHDHALGITRLNNYAGLSGFYLLRDEQEKKLNLPFGSYEICLMVQDRILDEKAQLLYRPTQDDGTPLPPGTWGPAFFGNLPVVNGAIYPYLDVEPRLYRLRFLNASNSRFFNLYFNLASTPYEIPSLVSFHQIGSDGGFLPRSVRMDKLLLAPAERADLLIDFSTAKGKTLTLSNDAMSPYPGWQVPGPLYAPLNELMQFRVRLPISATKEFSIPQEMPFSELRDSADFRTRDFVLQETFDKTGRTLGVRINRKGYDDPVSETVKLGSTEKWRFINNTDDSHPMHLHLVQFQILERQGYDPVSLRKDEIRLIGKPRKPAPNERGWKDTAVVNPGEVLTIIVRFEGYAGRYIYHCHMLEHEDNDMMRPYDTVG